MTKQEQRADEFLIVAKENVKGAMSQLKPNAKDPLAQSLLKNLDELDVTRKLLATRFQK